MSSRNPINFVISGPGGVGKGTIVEELIKRDDSLWLSRSWTTRKPRVGEDPDAYVFATRESFEERVKAGGFLEWVEFLDYLQGSPVPDIPSGSDAVFEIDIKGAAAILEADPSACSIFVDTPDLETQRKRLLGRGDPLEVVERRIDKGLEERQAAAELGSIVVINDDLESAIAEIQAIIARRRSE